MRQKKKVQTLVNCKSNDFFMKGRYLSLLFLLLLPLVFVFDVILFFWTKTGCFQMGCLSEFFRTSSLSASLLADTLRNWRK